MKIIEKCGCSYCGFRAEIDATNTVLVNDNDYDPDFVYCSACARNLIYYGFELNGPDTTTAAEWEALPKKLSTKGQEIFTEMMINITEEENE